MKYLRKYEGIEEGIEYKAGDKIILDMDALLDFYKKQEPPSPGLEFIKKLDLNNDYIHKISHKDGNFYAIAHRHWSTCDYFFIKKHEIFGLATPENIQEYEAIRNSRKFNL